MECHKNTVISNLELPGHFHPSQGADGQNGGDENGREGGVGEGRKRRKEERQ